MDWFDCWFASYFSTGVCCVQKSTTARKTSWQSLPCCQRTRLSLFLQTREKKQRWSIKSFQATKATISFCWTCGEPTEMQTGMTCGVEPTSWTDATSWWLLRLRSNYVRSCRRKVYHSAHVVRQRRLSGERCAKGYLWTRRKCCLMARTLHLTPRSLSLSIRLPFFSRQSLLVSSTMSWFRRLRPISAFCVWLTRNGSITLEKSTLLPPGRSWFNNQSTRVRAMEPFQNNIDLFLALSAMFRSYN